MTEPAIERRSLLLSKPLALTVVALLGAATFLAWSREWFLVELAPGSSVQYSLGVAGDSAAASLVPLALATLAVVAALAIASPVVRVILAVILAALGAGVALTGIAAVSDPLGAVSGSVIELTGLSGSAAVSTAVASVTVTAWPAIAVAIGAVQVAVALAIALTTRRWRGASRRYDAPGDPRSTPQASTVSDWDSLSGGEDPTGTADAR